MTLEDAAGRTGTVTVGPKTLTVGPLSQADEVRLLDQLRAMLKAERGDYLTANKAMVEAAAPQDRGVVVETLVRMEAQREPISFRAADEYRHTPKGCAFELYTRAKKFTPGVTLAEVEAVVTAANCVEVAQQLAEAIAPGKAPTRSASPT